MARSSTNSQWLDLVLGRSSSGRSWQESHERHQWVSGLVALETPPLSSMLDIYDTHTN